MIVDPIIYEDLSQEEFRGNAVWFCDLSNGRRVYGKPGKYAWLELQKYLEENDSISIVGLGLKFRDHYVGIGGGAHDYFLMRGSQCWSSGSPQELFLAGYRIGEKVLVKKFISPALIHQEDFDEMRSLDDESVKIGLIRNNLSE